MLRLTEEIGQPVAGPDGVVLGRVLDLVVGLDRTRPLVRALVVGARRRPDVVVPWWQVASFEHTAVLLRAPAASSPTSDAVPPVAPRADGVTLPLADDEILLGRDVLDTQIVDVEGRRVERVGDVLLERRDDQQLEVVAVDVGFGAVSRRLHLGVLARRLPERAIDLDDLHLTSARGHVVQLGTTSAALHQLDAYELAHLIARLRVEDAADVLEVVPAPRAARAVEVSHPEIRHRVLRAMVPHRRRAVLDELPDATARRARAHLAEPPGTRRRTLRHRGWHRTPPIDARHTDRSPLADGPPPADRPHGEP